MIQQHYYNPTNFLCDLIGRMCCDERPKYRETERVKADLREGGEGLMVQSPPPKCSRIVVNLET